jgi:proteasome assembly chaperone 3
MDFSDAPGNESKAIRSRMGADIINGVHTDIVHTEFSNCLFIIVSQYEKLGTLLSVRQDVALDNSGITTYNVQTLLGEDELETNVIARNLASVVNSPKPILFALALQDKSPEMLRRLADFVGAFVSP